MIENDSCQSVLTTLKVTALLEKQKSVLSKHACVSSGWSVCVCTGSNTHRWPEEKFTGDTAVCSDPLQPLTTPDSPAMIMKTSQESSLWVNVVFTLILIWVQEEITAKADVCSLSLDAVFNNTQSTE